MNSIEYSYDYAKENMLKNIQNMWKSDACSKGMVYRINNGVLQYSTSTCGPWKNSCTSENVLGQFKWMIVKPNSFEQFIKDCPFATSITFETHRYGAAELKVSLYGDSKVVIRNLWDVKALEDLAIAAKKFFKTELENTKLFDLWNQ